jgi:predicted RecB family nuclease
MLIGTITHDVLHILLVRLSRTTAPIDRARFDDYVQRTVSRLLSSTRLDELAYGTLTTDPSSEVLAATSGCLHTFLDSRRYQWFIETAAHNPAVWIIEPPGFGETRLDGLKLYCKVDALVAAADQYYLFDWKTGRRDQEKHRKQLVGYASWATYHLATEPESIHPTVVYLKPGYDEYSETFNSFDLDAFRVQVKAETDDMLAYCRDIDQNIPLDKSAFPMIDNPRVCERCSFRGLCYPDEYRASLDN